MNTVIFFKENQNWDDLFVSWQFDHHLLVIRPIFATANVPESAVLDMMRYGPS